MSNTTSKQVKILILSCILLMSLGCTSPVLLTSSEPREASAPSIGVYENIEDASNNQPEHITIATFSVPNDLVYVLDPRKGELSSEVIMIDVSNGRIAQTIGTRYKPSIVADGKDNLYVLDSYAYLGYGALTYSLNKLTLTSGELQRDILNLQNPSQYQFLPRQTYLRLSPNGKYLYYKKAMGVGVIDLQTLAIGKDFQSPNCEPYNFHVTVDSVYAICGNGAVVRFNAMTGEELYNSVLPGFLADSASGGKAWVQTSALVKDKVIVISNQGELFRVDSNGLVLDSEQGVDLVIEANWTIAGSRIIEVSPDGNLLYVGFYLDDGVTTYDTDPDMPGYDAESANEVEAYRDYAEAIWVYDTTTWNRVGVIELSTPILNFALSRDGTTLYGINPQQKRLLVMDSHTGTEIKTIPLTNSTSPAQVIVP